jgi:hypothetical protein
MVFVLKALMENDITKGITSIFRVLMIGCNCKYFFF